MKTSHKVTILILLQLFILNGLFVFRESNEDFYKDRQLWNRGQFKGGPFDFIKLYYSHVSDEAYYYEWSTIVLGKSFEPHYPSFGIRESIRNFFFEKPKLRIPYQDIEFEYPPLIIVPILAARFISYDYLSYTRALAGIITLAYLGILWMIYSLWRQIPQNERLSWPTLLSLSLASMLALGNLYVTRLDVFPSLLYLLALYTFLKGRYYQSAIWIVVGFFTKGYSILLAPLFCLFLLYQKKYRELLISSGLIIFLLVGIFIVLGWLTQGQYLDIFRFQVSRGIQIESLYALIPYLSHLLFGIPIHISFNYSFQIAMPHIEVILKLSQIIPLLLFSFLYVLFWRDLKRMQEAGKNPPVLWVIESSLILVFAFIITFKVLSPQFLIWLTPLIFLANPRRKKYLFSIFISLLILTQVIWPNFYMLLERAHPLGVLLLSIRNLGLVILFIWLLLERKERVKFQ